MLTLCARKGLVDIDRVRFAIFQVVDHDRPRLVSMHRSEEVAAEGVRPHYRRKTT